MAHLEAHTHTHTHTVQAQRKIVCVQLCGTVGRAGRGLGVQCCALFITCQTDTNPHQQLPGDQWAHCPRKWQAARHAGPHWPPHTHTLTHNNHKLLCLCAPACVCAEGEREGNCWAVQSQPWLEYRAQRSQINTSISLRQRLKGWGRQGRGRGGGKGGVKGTDFVVMIWCIAQLGEPRTCWRNVQSCCVCLRGAAWARSTAWEWHKSMSTQHRGNIICKCHCVVGGPLKLKVTQRYLL